MKKIKTENKKMISVLLIIVIIIGIVVIAVSGLNVGLVYRKNTVISIKLDTNFDNSIIKNIAKEVYQNQEVLVQKVEIYEDMVAITVESTTDEQKQELLNKINEFYAIEKNLNEDVTVQENTNVRLRSLIEELITSIVISFILVMVYIAIRYRKNNIIEILVKSSIKIGGILLLLLSIIAITRIPVNRLTVPLFLVTYGLSIYGVMSNNEKK